MKGTAQRPSHGRSRVICVIGSPRSGTSITTRILNLAGVYLGPEEELIPPGPWNPRGFWEYGPIADLNERLLTSLGGSIRNPPQSLPIGWEKSEEFAAERREARELLDDTFGDRPLWGWKDPRASLTLPFWRLMLPHMRYVICLRNPVDVAASAEGIEPLALSREEIFAAWTRYVAAAFANTSGSRRSIVSYDDYVDRSQDTIERLWRFAGNEQSPTGPEAERLKATVDRSLLRHRTSPADVLRDDDLPPQAGALYLIAMLLSHLDSRPDESGSALQLSAAVDSYALRQLGNERQGQRR